MALWIPRIEWNDQTVSASVTNGNATLTSIASTTAINVGMVASGTGIPSNALVISKTANSVTLNVDATSSGSYAVTFFERYDFEFPPVKDTEEKLKPKQTVLDALDGSQQFTTLYLEATRDLEFYFVNQTDADKLKNNFYLYAYKGNFFRYFPDKDEAPVYNMQLDKNDFVRTRQVKKHPNFKYSLGFTFRRVVE